MSALEPNPQEDRHELAEDRTELAGDRTLLANERTFAGWCRTGFALIGVGLGSQALFHKVEPTWIAKAMATIFVALGVWVIWTAGHRAADLLSKNSGNDVHLTQARSFRFLAVGVSIGASLLLVCLWVLI